VKLPPFSVKRLDAAWRRQEPPVLPGHPRATAERLRFTSRHLKVVINPGTGLVDWAGPARARRSHLSKGAMRPTAFHDVSHSWSCGDPERVKGVWERRYGRVFYPPWGRREYFSLATRRRAAEICLPPGGRRTVDPVRIVEDGPVRTVVEVVFAYRRSAIVRRYIFSRGSPVFEVRDRISWNENSMMLKVECPLGFQPGSTTAETPYSACAWPAPEHHFDMPNQRWVKASAKRGDRWTGVVNNCSHGHSLHGGSLYVNVLRSPPYGISEWTAEAEGMEDRCLRRQDKGEHEVRLGFLFGEGKSDLPLVRAAGVMNAPPAWISYHPPGPGRADRASLAPPAVEVSAGNVEVTALKRAERGNALVIRLMEHAGRRTECQLSLKRPNGRVRVTIGPYRLKTILVRRSGKRLVFTETNLVEEPCG
jgi:alpha-mannosidase